MGTRCKWCNESNSLYKKYHDEEWGRRNFTESYLFEMLVLESFQAGLSWECVLNKRENFRRAFDNFNPDKIRSYGEQKIAELYRDSSIIRNKLKILAVINNAKIFKEIQIEFGSFANFLQILGCEKTYYEVGLTTSPLSDKISTELKNRGMRFVGSTIIYSYLQAIGVIYSHEKDCFLYRNA